MLASGAAALIVDLEDFTAPARRDEARCLLATLARWHAGARRSPRCGSTRSSRQTAPRTSPRNAGAAGRDRPADGDDAEQMRRPDNAIAGHEPRSASLAARPRSCRYARRRSAAPTIVS